MVSPRFELGFQDSESCVLTKLYYKTRVALFLLIRSTKTDLASLRFDRRTYGLLSRLWAHRSSAELRC